MRNVFGYIFAVALLMIALVPIKFYRSIKDKSMNLGVVVAMAINLHFYFESNSAAGHSAYFMKWHIPAAIVLPTLFLLPFFLIFLSPRQC